jgi:hypothetical protein
MVLGSTSAGRAQTESPAAARGDSLLASFRTEAAIRAYRLGLSARPDDPDLLWKTARALMQWSIETPGEEGDEERLEEAVRLSRRAVETGPGVARAHTILAASVGLYGQLVGRRYRLVRAREVIDMAHEVHREARRAIDLDPYDFGPYVILGIFHRELAMVHPIVKAIARAFLGSYPDVSVERSQEYLLRATALAPGDVTARLELARTYIAMDQEGAARRELEIVIRRPPADAMDRVELSEARDLLEEIS